MQFEEFFRIVNYFYLVLIIHLNLQIYFVMICKHIQQNVISELKLRWNVNELYIICNYQLIN